MSYKFHKCVIFHRRALCMKTHAAQWEMGSETHQAEVISVNMVALGIHIPRHDMVAMT